MPIHLARRTGKPRSSRPMLLALVFGVVLVLVGVTASALVAVTTENVARTTVEAIVERDRSLVHLFVNGNVRVSDLTGTRHSPVRLARLRELMNRVAHADSMLSMELRRADGALVVAVGRDGQPPADLRSAGLDTARAGTANATLVAANGGPATLEEHMPLTFDGEVLGVVSLRRDATSMLAGLDAAGRDIIVVTVVAALLLAVVLFGVFRAAHARLVRQHAELLESTRRDPLTGMLNHGAIVTELEAALNAARRSGGHVTVALVDIDNFRLFNDAHGHEAGDEVLLLTARLTSELAGEGGMAARYGPDEFLIVRPDEDTNRTYRLLTELQATLRDAGVQFGQSEELPVSVSAGIAAFPRHASSVTDLLSEASAALSAAKAGGGDAVTVAHKGGKDVAGTASFDILQGLVIAVDSKDRYTKRHSEDVARYAVFLARRLGLDEEELDTIHLAGLLHDVGKIGIPDVLLRKPSKLTPREYAIFQQHVALGDAIVRDLPRVEVVRAGIRHHHERWDGRGYLHRLEGEQIPLIGRVLAVGDAFSAMTTTRPYRKALSVEEALKRLGDAAGTQLQEDLVACFVTGIETDADPPLPGDPLTGVWRANRRVA